MKFTEQTSVTDPASVLVPLYRRSILILLMSAMVGCQFAGAPREREDNAQEMDATEAAAMVRTPNPYLLDRPSVPAQVRDRFDSALAALREQQWEIAETDLLWITQNHPQFSGAYLNLALLYEKSGQADKVAPAFQQAIAANSKNVAAYNQYGIYLRSQGKFTEAEQIYRQALAVWPDSPETHLNLGILYDLYMGNLEQALQHYRAYQNLQPEPNHQVQGWIVDTERRLQQAGG